MNPDSPAECLSSDSLLLRSVTWCGLDHAVDVRVADGRIESIHKVATTPSWYCLPPLADLHVHACRAFTTAHPRPRGLEDAVRNVQALFETFEVEDYRRHASRLLEAAFRHGTTRLRTHADLSPVVGLDALHGSLLAAEEWSAHLELEVVAFAAPGSDPASASGAEWMREAASQGASLLGGVPAFCENPRATLEALLDLAVELDLPVDVHLDEHLSAARCQSRQLAEITLQRGLEGRVTLSHGCAVAALPLADRLRTIEQLAEARITVIALPRTNLYLQDAGLGSPLRRGITCVREMLAHDVPVRFASDNVRDAFYPYGEADLIAVAMDGVLATQLDEPAVIIEAICDGQRDFRTGQVASMVLVRGSDFDTVLSEQSSNRWLLTAGRLQAPGMLPPLSPR